MASDQSSEKITFKCSYCGNLITATYSPFHVSEICPACRGNVMIPLPKANAAGTAPGSFPEGTVIKESGEWPAAHYAQPGASFGLSGAPTASPPNAIPPIQPKSNVISVPVTPMYTPPPPLPPPAETRLLNRSFAEISSALANSADKVSQPVTPIPPPPMSKPEVSAPLQSDSARENSYQPPAPSMTDTARVRLNKALADVAGVSSESSSEMHATKDMQRVRKPIPTPEQLEVRSQSTAPDNTVPVMAKTDPENATPDIKRMEPALTASGILRLEKNVPPAPPPKTGLSGEFSRSQLGLDKTPIPGSKTTPIPGMGSGIHKRLSAFGSSSGVTKSPTQPIRITLETGESPKEKVTPIPESKFPPVAEMKLSESPQPPESKPMPIKIDLEQPDPQRTSAPATASEISGSPTVMGSIGSTEPNGADSESALNTETKALPSLASAEAESALSAPPAHVPPAEPLSPFVTKVDPPKTQIIDMEKLHTEEAPKGATGAPQAIVPPPVSTVEPATSPSPLSRTMEERQDPTRPAASAASISPSALNRPAVDLMRDSQHAGAIPSQKSPRWGLIAASILIVGGAGFFVAHYVMKGMAQAKLQSELRAKLDQAARAFAVNDVHDAAKNAQEVEGAWSMDDAVEPKFKAELDPFVQKYKAADKVAVQLDTIWNDAKTDPAGVRDRLELKRGLLEHENKPDTNRPLLAIVHDKLTELEGIESDQKLTKLHARLADAEKLYKEGKIDEAAKISDDIVTGMPKKPAVQDHQMQQRAEILSKRAGDLDILARQTASAKGDKFTDVKRRLKDKIGELDPANADFKPLLDKYNALLAKVEDGEAVYLVTLSRKTLDDAETQYKQERVEEAAKKAAQVLADIPSKLADQNKDLIKRAEILVAHGKVAAEAAGIRASAKDEKIADAKKKLQALIDKFNPLDAGTKPLTARLKTLNNELTQDERAYKLKLNRLKKNKEGNDYELSTNDAKYIQGVLKKFSELDPLCAPGELDFDGYDFNYGNAAYKLCLHHESKDQIVWFIEANDLKIGIDPRHFGPQDKAFRPRFHRAFYHAFALADAMTKAGIKSDDVWDTKEEAPFVSARRFDKAGNEYIFLNDRLYTGKAQEKTGEQKKIEEEFRARAEALAKAIENDAPTSEDVRNTIAFAVRASAVEADWNDHLEGEFVRKVIQEGYIENNMPGTAERLKKELADYRAGYKTISEPFLNFIGQSKDAGKEGEAAELRTFEDRAVWRIYDKSANVTSFAITNPDDEKDCLFILYDFPGKLTEMPESSPPLKVRMNHQAVGTMATYDPTTNKMDYDKEKWEFAAGLEVPPVRDSDRVLYGYGSASWALPPHVLLIAKNGKTRGLVTPHGRVDVQDFKLIADPAKRKDAMDAFMDKLVRVLPNGPEGCYPHLYFRYFFQYTLDSPVTDHPDLLGSRPHTGDIHQTTYQSLERLMGGRYVGDCDDIAELYMTLERKMGNLAYVMSLPGHAACGWVEKKPGDSAYNFYILQTGPARHFEDTTLDKVVEKAYRAFDAEGTARFDPKSLAFNFRFNNEPTRTTYWLSSRMYVDAAYGEAMEKVQSYWHFHFYALGIQTMLEMIEGKGDRVSENCNEVAGLYGQVREVEKSIFWSRESIKNLKASERLSKMNEEYRIATMWRSEHDNEKAYEAIKASVRELKAIQATPETFNYLGMRMQVASLLLILDRPWDCWDLLRPDIAMLGNPRNYFLKLEHVGVLTSAYLKMQDMIRNRKVLTPAENQQMKALATVLDTFYSNGKAIFEDSDGLDDYMRKYAYIGTYYAGKYGRKKYLEELMKDGPYPELDGPRKTPSAHQNRKNQKDLVEEDWKWIRLSLLSYSIGIGDAIDLDDPPEKWRVDEAVKLCDQMKKVGVTAAKFGSLGSFDFILLSNRVLRDFLVKDWADLEETIKETAKRDWAKLTTDVSETFGRGARFCTPEEFAEQYKMFTKYIKVKTSFFTVVYEAYRADGFKHSVLASKIALDLNPGDEDMKREATYLAKLADERIKKAEEKAKADKEKAEKEAKEKAAVPEKLKE